MDEMTEEELPLQQISTRVRQLVDRLMTDPAYLEHVRELAKDRTRLSEIATPPLAFTEALADIEVAGRLKPFQPRPMPISKGQLEALPGQVYEMLERWEADPGTAEAARLAVERASASDHDPFDEALELWQIVARSPEELLDLVPATDGKIVAEYDSTTTTVTTITFTTTTSFTVTTLLCTGTTATTTTTTTTTGTTLSNFC